MFKTWRQSLNFEKLEWETKEELQQNCVVWWKCVDIIAACQVLPQLLLPTQSQCNDDMSKLIIKRVKSLAATLCLLLLLHRILQPEVNTVKCNVINQKYFKV